MRETLREGSHLIRLAALVLALICGFLVFRRAMVPAGFGELGHYRAGAIDEIAAKPMAFAGQDNCQLCHADQFKARSAGRHAGVKCEACHGPLAAHADSGGEGEKPKIADVAALCKTCHEKDAAKPRAFPQVATAEHYGGSDPCTSCHVPHAPKM